MRNHFHFLVRIKKESEITSENKILPSQSFSNFFNAYTKAFNKSYTRHGPLFERPFRKIIINNENYFKNLITYIHNNPVHHQICDHPLEYSWSSYMTCLSEKSTKLMRKEVIDIFENIENFKYMHQQKENSPDNLQNLTGF